MMTRSKTAAAKAQQKPIKDNQSSFAKLDLSKCKEKPVSTPFVIAKSTEQKLAEALDTIDRLKNDFGGLNYRYMSLAKSFNSANAEIEYLKKRLQTRNVEYDRAWQLFKTSEDMYEKLRQQNIKV